MSLAGLIGLDASQLPVLLWASPSGSRFDGLGIAALEGWENCVSLFRRRLSTFRDTGD